MYGHYARSCRTTRSIGELCVLQSKRRGTVRAHAYQSTTDYDYDLFTIGGGSGGVRASRFSTPYGARVACCELPFAYISGEFAGGYGGTCVLRGCVPKKLVMYCSEYSEFFRDAEGFGYTKPEPELDWGKFMEKKRKELQRLNGAYGNTLKNAKVDMIEGRAKLLDAHTVLVGDRKYTSKYFCLAVGGTPHKINLPGEEYCINSDQLLELSELPKTMAIVGGGYIGVEFGGMFNNFGTKIDFFLRSEKLLKGFDEEVRDGLTTEYKKRGIVVNNCATPKEIRKNEDGSVEMVYKDMNSGSTHSKVFDQILMATGRVPNIRGLGLEAAGVEVTNKGYIKVDEYSKTTADNIYAIGDVTGRLALTPVALMEGGAVAKTLFGGQPTKADHEYVATAVFSQPHIGTVGWPEHTAAEKFGDIDVYSGGFRPMRNTISGNETRGLQKIIVDAKSNRVVGMHMLGPDAGEIMQGFGAAVKMGITKAQLDTVVGIHPTAAEEFVTMRTPVRKYRNNTLERE